MGIRATLLALGLLFSGHALAQCPFYVGGAWPTSVSFDPAQPAAGASVDLVLGPATWVDIDPYTVSTSGSDIVIDGNFFDESQIGTTPPPHVTRVPLGQLAAGSYLVHVRLNIKNSFECPEVITPLVIGGAGGAPPVVGVPAGGIPAWTWLAIGLFGIAWRMRNRLKTRDSRA